MTRTKPGKNFALPNDAYFDVKKVKSFKWAICKSEASELWGVIFKKKKKIVLCSGQEGNAFTLRSGRSSSGSAMQLGAQGFQSPHNRARLVDSAYLAYGMNCATKRLES